MGCARDDLHLRVGDEKNKKVYRLLKKKREKRRFTATAPWLGCMCFPFSLHVHEWVSYRCTTSGGGTAVVGAIASLVEKSRGCRNRTDGDMDMRWSEDKITTARPSRLDVSEHRSPTHRRVLRAVVTPKELRRHRHGCSTKRHA